MKTVFACVVFFLITFQARAVLSLNGIGISHSYDPASGNSYVFVPLDISGNPVSQAGVLYTWTITDANGHQQTLNGAYPTFYYDSAALFQVCVFAKESGYPYDTASYCKSFYLYPGINTSGYYPVHANFYYDANHNCTRESGEPLIPMYGSIKGRQTGNYLTFNGDSLYDWLQPDTYDISIQNLGIVLSCHNWFATDSLHSGHHHLIPIEPANHYHPDNAVLQLQASGWNPGYTASLETRVFNGSVYDKYIKVVLHKPDSIIFDQSTLSPVQQNSKTITWSVPVKALSFASIYTSFLISANKYMYSDSVWMYTVCDSLGNDADTTNNYAGAWIYLNGSYDPNYAEVLNPDALQTGKPVHYRIHFQNTGTAAARRIVVSDQLPAELDPKSVHITASSHGCNARIDGNAVAFVFDNINLPDSASDPAGSQGFVDFTCDILQKSANRISNLANIYFDFNAPVTTNTAVLKRQTAGLLAVNPQTSGYVLYPNPAASSLHLLRKVGTGTNETIRCIDISGRLWWQGSLGIGQTAVEIDIAPLQPGLYLLQCGNGQCIRWVKGGN